MPSPITHAISIVPISLDEANAFVALHHRHHQPVTGHKFSIAIADSTSSIIAVAIIGRPVSRILDDGWTLEVNRLASDGAANACSMLYRAAWRAASALGYRRLITYTLPAESGSSLRASGFKLIGLAGGGSWNRFARPRFDSNPLQQKFRWELRA